MESKIAVVTGANQGLGLAVVRGLCHSLGERGVVYLTARDPQRGQVAVEKLRAEGLKPAFHLLNVRDDDSVASFARFIREHHGGVDIVVSNAAARMSRDVPHAQEIRGFVDTNNHGTHRILEAFVPLLNDGARFLVVASSFGSLTHLAVHLHPLFDPSSSSLEDIRKVMDDYVGLVETDQATRRGWPAWINIPSKIGQVASMKIVAREMHEQFELRDILMNAVCPGLVDTDASRPWFADMSAAQSPDQAALDLLWLACLPAGTREPYGELVQHRRIIPFA